MHTNVELIYIFNCILMLMVSCGELLFVCFLPWDLPYFLSYIRICGYMTHLDPLSEVILKIIFFFYRILCLVYSIRLNLYIVKIFNSSSRRFGLYPTRISSTSIILFLSIQKYYLRTSLYIRPYWSNLYCM